MSTGRASRSLGCACCSARSSFGRSAARCGSRSRARCSTFCASCRRQRQRRNAATPPAAAAPTSPPNRCQTLTARARASAQLLGSLWFVCLPLLVLLAFALPPYRRHQVVAGGSIVLQAVALALLSTLFLQRSEYYRISSLAHLGSVFDAGFSAGRSNKIAVD